MSESLFEDFKIYKTKEILKLLGQVKVNPTEKILIILSKPNYQFWLAARNLKNITVTTAACLNIKQLLHANNILLSQNSLDLINSNYKKSYE